MDDTAPPPLEDTAPPPMDDTAPPLYDTTPPPMDDTAPPPLQKSYPPPPPPPDYTAPLPPGEFYSLPAPPLRVGLGVGIGMGGILLLVAVGVLIILRRRRREHGLVTSSGVPPQGSEDDPLAGSPQHCQPNTPPPPDNIVAMMPKPTPPPGIALNTKLSPGRVFTSPATSSNLGSERPPPSLSLGISLGFTKSAFTYEELAMATDGFSDANLLGQGGFGYVHKGVLPNGKQVAIKQLKAGSGQGEREYQAEIEIISRVHHKHLVSLVGYCMSGAQRMLVYEFVPNNTLEFHLHGKGRPTMSWTTRMKIALGAAKGLAYLHEDCQPKIVHRDIKAANILLDSNFEAKVADFGLAKFSSDADTHVSTRVMGTFGYLAPEYAASGKLTDKSDVFSFGVLLLELITGRQPMDKTQSFKDDSMVDWARPLLTRALQGGNFETLVDPRLQKDYNSSEMARMVACAAVSVHHSSRRRPRMSQMVQALQGNIPLDDLNEGIRPGHSAVYSPYGSADYDNSQYKEEMKNFRKLALQSQEHSTSEPSRPTSEFSGPTSESGLHPFSSSSEGQQTTQEMEMGEMKKDKKKFGESS